MSPTSAFTVYMHRELVDELDEGFSPMDGIQAINDIFVGLPLVHPSPVCKRRPYPKRLRLYSGRFEWYPSLGFNYVQIGNQLHVVELWFESNPTSRKVDVTLPETELEEHPASDYPSPPTPEPAWDIFDRPAGFEPSATKNQKRDDDR